MGTCRRFEFPNKCQKMAKSLRSKWKRKMRAVKRVRYGEKEAKMLNKIIEGAKARREEMEKEHKPEPLGEGSAENGEDKVALESMEGEQKENRQHQENRKKEQIHKTRRRKNCQTKRGR